MIHLHVIPKDDALRHAALRGCVCGPEWVRRPNFFLYFHDALDGKQREVHEYERVIETE